MAAIATVTLTVGRPMARVRVLAVAVTLLLVVDPLLVGSLGFQLSVAASLAIIRLGPVVMAALPGPAWCTDPLGVTIAAQLGVAPLLLAAFGPLPLASLPANLLAVPAAGAVMVWGMTAGLGAGLVGRGPAAALHLPTRVLLGWIGQVAQRAAAAPLGQVGVRELAIATAGLALLVAGSRWGRRALRFGGGAVGAAGLLLAVVAVHIPPALRTAPSPGIVRWHGPGTDVVVLGGGSWRSPLAPDGVLAALRIGGVRSIALLVVEDGVAPSVVDAVVARHPTGTIVAGRRTAGCPPAPPCCRSTERSSRSARCTSRSSRPRDGSSSRPGRARGRFARWTPLTPWQVVFEVPCPSLALGPHRFDIRHRALVMGILNRTPDSFFDRGSYYDFDAFLAKAEQLVGGGGRLPRRRRREGRPGARGGGGGGARAAIPARRGPADPVRPADLDGHVAGVGGGAG